MNELNTLAQRLRYAMEVLPFKKVKGVDLARAVGVKPPSVSDWLSGKSKTMEGENLLRAAKHLGVNPVWLATGKGEPCSDLTTGQNLLDGSISDSQDNSPYKRFIKLEELLRTIDLLINQGKLTNSQVSDIENTINGIIPGVKILIDSFIKTEPTSDDDAKKTA